MIVEDLMKKPVVIEKDILLSDVAKLMTKHKISSLIILFDEKIAGIITHEDIVGHFGEQKKVSEVMTKQVLTVKKNDKLQKAIDLIREKNITTIPVVDKNGLLVGIVRSKDILNEACASDDFLMD